MRNILLPTTTILLLACGGISATDKHAVSLQVPNCQDALDRLADAGSSANIAIAKADMQACVCGARGIEARNGGAPDAGKGPCPQ